MDRSWRKPERLTRRNHFFLQDPLPRLAELDPGATFEDVPRFVLLFVELEAQRLPLLDEEDLPGVVLRDRPDQLGAPGLLDRPWVEREPVEAGQVRREQVWGHCLAILRRPVGRCPDVVSRRACTNAQRVGPQPRWRAGAINRTTIQGVQ